jgi:hypothetical protein
MPDQWVYSEQLGHPTGQRLPAPGQFGPPVTPPQLGQPGTPDPWNASAPGSAPGQAGGYPPSMPPLQGMPPTAAQSGQPQWQQPQYPPPGYGPQYPPPGPPRRQPGKTNKGLIAGLGCGGLAVLVIIIAAVAAAGGGHSVQTSGSTAGGAAPKAAAKAAGIGSAITLTGNGGGEQVGVTVTKVITTAQPADGFSAASAGHRLYAVQFRLSNTGSAAYSDAPSNGAAVTDSAGQSYNAQLAGNAAGCPAFSAPENIAAGATGLGCITFEVPEAAKITKVQFTLDSGMGPQTGQWSVG